MTFPAFQDPLSTPVQFLKGIGPKRSEQLERVGVRTLFDLLLYVPRRYLDRTAVVTIRDLRRQAADAEIPGMTSAAADAAPARRDYTVVGRVRSFRVIGFGPKARFVLVLADETASMQCVWFGGVRYWRDAFHVDETLAVSGQPALYRGVLQIVHPDLDRLAPPDSRDSSGPMFGDDGSFADQGEVDWSKALNTGGNIPLYPSSQELARVGLDSAGFRRVIGAALRAHLGSVGETLPPGLLSERKLVPLRTAIGDAHFPKSDGDLAAALRRLKYEEFFYFQVKLALKRSLLRESTEGVAFNVRSALARKLVDALPFSLTRAQVRVVKEISADMEAPRPMNRLLQGDVGSGKTIVALIAMLIAADNGFQAAFMAPTELLAEQHFRTLAALTHGLPVAVRLLVGGQRSALRRDVLEDVRSGTARIVVGTHALFEKEVEFAALGLVVIDEQHRFGVVQRSEMRQKGRNPDVLVMTATPIPRTLSLTLYGDLDVSVIDELPEGRRPVRTVLKSEEEKETVVSFVRDQVRLGRQAYFVYPLIEESEKLDLKAATVYVEDLRKKAFPDLRLGLLHGRLPAEERERVMGSFLRREIDILVATTVIEVGIDVPNATVMVIENAERFGLSQLHQLRGRVGRGAAQSFCILVTKRWVAGRAARHGDPRSMLEAQDEARLAERRLATMVQTTDGFRIAEVDLELRGPGDFFGTRQSGLPEFRVANILTDSSILSDARHDAFAIVTGDARLSLPEHRMIATRLRSQLHDDLSLVLAG